MSMKIAITIIFSAIAATSTAYQNVYAESA